ncbi:MAG: SDR family oxidoreductase [Sandaracinaceae bacterium]|nr:SDR family oxidoreductase [Sandaracinaceae bacterium]
MTRLAPPDMKAKLEGAVPLKRFGTVEDVANVALFLASGAAGYVNGAIVVVDGGAWLPGMGAAFGLG